MTMTEQPSTLPDGTSPAGRQHGPVRLERSRPTVRYAGKIAQRELRRRPWRTALVVALIALPTCIMLDVMSYVRTSAVVDRAPGPDFTADLVIPYVDASPDREQAWSAGVSLNSFGVGNVASRGSTEVEAALPAGSTVQRAQGTFTSIMAANGDIVAANFVKIDLASDAAATWAPLGDGRAPGPGEVVLGADLADTLGVGVGDTLTLQQPPVSWHVAGIAPWNYGLMAVRDFDESQLAVNAGVLLVDLPAGTATADVEVLVETLGAYTPHTSRYAPDWSVDDYQQEGVTTGWLGAILVFVMFGVVIVATFATIARGQLVTVGQLATNGSTARFTQLVLAMQGFWSGVIGVAIGCVAGLITTLALRPFILASFWRPAERVEWSPLDVVLICTIGVVVATAAALLPGTALVRTSPLDALGGRPIYRRVPRWMVPAGLLTFFTGLLLLVVAASSSSDGGAAVSTLGVLLMVVGVSLIGPLAIQLASRAAPLMPLSIRISLRGLGRARLRSAAVVSSIAVVTGVMAVIVAGIQTSSGGPRPGDFADNVVIVAAYPSLEMRTPEGEPLLDDWGALVAAPGTDIDAVALRWVPATPREQVGDVSNVLSGASRHPLRVAVRPDGIYDNTDGLFLSETPEGELYGPPFDGVPSGTGPIEEIVNLPLIADPTTLAGFSLPESFREDLEVAGVASLTGRTACGYSNELAEPWDGRAVDGPSDLAAEEGLTWIPQIPTDGVDCYSTVGPFMSERFAIDHGFQIEPAGTVFVNPDPITGDERGRLGDDYAYPSVFVDWEYAGGAEFGWPSAVPSSVPTDSYGTALSGVNYYYPSTTDADFQRLQGIMVVVAVVVVTLITAIGLALAAVDSQRDRVVLEVIGARPKTQRYVAASDAWTLVMIGSTLGIPAALFASWVVTSTGANPVATGVPWLFIAAEFVVVPLVVAGFAYAAGLIRRRVRPMSALRRI